MLYTKFTNQLVGKCRKKNSKQWLVQRSKTISKILLKSHQNSRKPIQTCIQDSRSLETTKSGHQSYQIIDLNVVYYKLIKVCRNKETRKQGNIIDCFRENQQPGKHSKHIKLESRLKQLPEIAMQQRRDGKLVVPRRHLDRTAQHQPSTRTSTSQAPEQHSEHQNSTVQHQPNNRTKP